MDDKLKVKLYFLMGGKHQKNEIEVETHEPYTPEDWGVTVATTTIEIPLPDVSRAEMTNKMVGILEAKKKKKQAECQLELNEIDKKIGELLALEAPKE